MAKKVSKAHKKGNQNQEYMEQFTPSQKEMKYTEEATPTNKFHVEKITYNNAEEAKEAIEELIRKEFLARDDRQYLVKQEIPVKKETLTTVLEVLKNIKKRGFQNVLS